MSRSRHEGKNQNWLGRIKASWRARKLKRAAAYAAPSSAAKSKNLVVRGLKRFFVFAVPQWMHAAGELVKPPTKSIPWYSYYNPLYQFVWFNKFAWRWFISRPFTSLGPALPAILIAILFVVGGYLQVIKGDGWRRTEYRDLLVSTVKNKQFDVASIVARALVSIDPENIDYRIQHATIEDSRGNEALSVELMSRLVNTRKSGTAAMWLVSKRFDLNKLAEWQPDDEVKFKFLMQTALQNLTGRNLQLAKTTWASFLSQKGAAAEAVRYLESVAPDLPEYHFTVALLYNSLGQTDLAMRHAESARQFYSGKLLVEPSNASLRVELAKAMVFLGREEEAAQICGEGFVLSSDPMLKVVSAEALAAKVNRLARETPGAKSLLQRMGLLRKAASIAPNSNLVMELIVQLVIECRENKNGELETLRVDLLRGLNPAATHFVQGTIALLNNDLEAAQSHLTLAKGEGENLPGLLNNLAVAMSSVEGANLEDALRFADEAVKQLPDHPYIRETRGQIYLKLKRYKEAVTDLEYGLKAEELLPAVCPSLAKAYRALGLDDLAQRYELASAKLNKSTTP